MSIDKPAKKSKGKIEIEYTDKGSNEIDDALTVLADIVIDSYLDKLRKKRTNKKIPNKNSNQVKWDQYEDENRGKTTNRIA